jgi:hypothetical protein
VDAVKVPGQTCFPNKITLTTIYSFLEGWPLLIVETVNEDSQRKNERGFFLVNSLGLSNILPVKKIFVLPWLLKSAQHEIHFSSSIFQFLGPHRPANWADRRAGSPVSYCVSLVFFLTLFLMAHRRPVKGGSLDGLPYRLTFRRSRTDGIHQKRNSLTYNFVEVSGHNLGVLRLEVSVYNVNITNQKLN